MPWVPASRRLLFLLAAAVAWRTTTITCAGSAGLPGEDGEEATTALNFIFVSSLNSSSFRSAGTAPAVDLALERVNAEPSLLPGYRLQYSTLLDSQVIAFSRVIFTMHDQSSILVGT